MSTSAAELPDVNRWLDELEASVVTAEISLRKRKWRELGEAIALQRRYTHGLKNALEKQDGLTPEKRASVNLRIQSILDRRAIQIRRLERFQDNVGRRLRELTRFKYAVRDMMGERPAIIVNTIR